MFRCFMHLIVGNNHVYLVELEKPLGLLCLQRTLASADYYEEDMNLNLFQTLDLFHCA